MITVIDNYDSFTWNLVQQIGSIAETPIEVLRNDEFDPEVLLATAPQALVISPGPGVPSRAGRIVELIRLNRSIPLLGICLGHQAIGEAFGARVVRGDEPVHGKVNRIRHRGARLFEGSSPEMFATRYHSLIVDRASLPPELLVDAESEDGTVMAMSHSELPVFGIQFHPESYGTEGGENLIRNFLKIGGVQ